MAQKFNGNVEVGGTLLAGILESEVLGDKLKETVQRFIAEYGDKTVHDLFSEKEQNITESLAEFEQAFSLQRETLEQTFCTQMQNPAAWTRFCLFLLLNFDAEYRLV